MNTFSHIRIGKFLCVYMKKKYGVDLDRKSFIRGNYLPDFSIGLITNPHYMKNKLKFVEREIAALSQQQMLSANFDREYSRRLGTICHYIADFFCFSHSELFQENMAIHVAYEGRLHRFLTAQENLLNDIHFLSAGPRGADSISEALAAYHTDYLRARKSMGNDIVFSIQVCVDTLVSLIPAGHLRGGLSELPACEYLTACFQ